MIIQTRYEHISLDQNDVPLITGSKMKVVELVVANKAYGWSPEELHFQYPHLSLGQIFSALAYYWDHQAELDQDIEARLKRIDQIKQTLKPTPLKVRLQAKGSV